MAYNFQYQAKTQPTLVIIASMATWFMPLAEPVRDQAYEVSSDVSTFVVPVAASTDVPSAACWDQPLSEPVRLKSGVAVQQSNQSPGVFIVTPPVTDTTIGWYQPLGDPVKDQPFEVASDISTFVVPVAPFSLFPDKWGYPWSEPVRQKPGLGARYQQAAWLVKAAPFLETVTEDRWHQPWSEPTRRKAVLQLNQPYTPRVSVAVTEDQFHQPWSEPVRRKLQIPIAQSYTPFLVTTEDRWHQPWSEPVRRKPPLQVSQSYTPFVAPAVTPIDWAQELYQPRPESFEVVSDTSVFVAIAATVTVTDIKWQPVWPDRIYRKTFPVYHQQSFTAPVSPPVVTPMDWAQELYQPRLEGFDVVSATSVFIAIAAVTPPSTNDIRWQTRWPDRLYRKTLPVSAYQVTTHIPVKTLKPFSVTTQGPVFTQITQYQSRAVPPPIVTPPPAVTPIDWAQELYQPRPESYEVVNITGVFVATATPAPTDIKWFRPLSEPSKPKSGLRTASQQFLAWSGFTPTAETITEDKWHQPWSTPLRSKSRLSAGSQQVLALAPNPIIPSFGWYGALVDPPKPKAGLRASNQQFLAFIFTPTAETITEDKWHQPWSIPVRFKPGLRADLQQTLALQPRLPVIFEGSWHYPWSEPVRQKPGLRPGLQQALAWQPRQPVIFEGSWHYPWSEPVRQKPGLRAGLQQALAWPSLIIVNPIPPVTLVMNARETNNDIFEGAIVLSTPATRCLVSIKEIVVPAQNLQSIHEI